MLWFADSVHTLSVTMRRISTSKSKSSFAMLLICSSVMRLTLMTFMYIRPQKRETLLLQDEPCELSQTWLLYPTTSDLNVTDWSFNKRVQCPEFNISNYPSKRKMTGLQCNRNTNL